MNHRNRHRRWHRRLVRDAHAGRGTIGPANQATIRIALQPDVGGNVPQHGRWSAIDCVAELRGQAGRIRRQQRRSQVRRYGLHAVTGQPERRDDNIAPRFRIGVGIGIGINQA